MNSSKYKPILKKAEAETSAVGKCKWMLALLEILTLNHLPHIDDVLKDVKTEVRKRTNKILVFLFVVLLVTLVTNPQVLGVASKLMQLVF